MEQSARLRGAERTRRCPLRCTRQRFTPLRPTRIPTTPVSTPRWRRPASIHSVPIFYHADSNIHRSMALVRDPLDFPKTPCSISPLCCSEHLYIKSWIILTFQWSVLKRFIRKIRQVTFGVSCTLVYEFQRKMGDGVKNCFVWIQSEKWYLERTFLSGNCDDCYVKFLTFIKS